MTAKEKYARIRSRRVVVDDNYDSANTSSVLLQVKGHVPRVAHGARDALALVRFYRPHLILVDLSMPEVGGFQLLRRLRQTDAPTETL
ncbi:TPA: response regulator [Burkholderia vietnamiensis]|nr:response regulator [Burkholderia vietnamiensis]